MKTRKDVQAKVQAAKAYNRMLATADPSLNLDKEQQAVDELLARGGAAMVRAIRAFDSKSAARQSREALAWNRGEKTEKPMEPTEAEKRQVEITNEYRMMFGLRAVKIHDKLILAARGHSEYMRKTNNFAHNIKGHPDGETPSARCSKAGFGGGVTENIARSSGDTMTPEQAHDGWIHSSGHHRNIVADGHTWLGSGNAGGFWTQNFG